MIEDTGKNRDSDSSLTPEEAELLSAFRAKQFDAVGEVVGKRIAAEEKLDRKYALDIIACEFISLLDEQIDDFAARLADARGEEGQWANEIAANDLLHAVAEFLIQADIGDGYERESMAKRHHLTEIFAQDFFDVSPLGDGTLVSTKAMQ